MNIALSTLKLFVSRFASQLMGFVALTYFARELGPEQLGIFFLFQAVLSILLIPADMGIREGIEKRISEGNNPGKMLSTGLLLKLSFIIVLSVILLAFKWRVNRYVGGSVAEFLVLALLLNGLLQVVERTLKGELRVGEIGVLQVSKQFIWAAAGAALVYIGLDYHALVYSLLAGLGVAVLIGLWKISTRFEMPSVANVRVLWDYSKYSFIGSVGASFYNWMDILVIGYFLTEAHVGAYEMAWRVKGAVILLSSTISMTIFPQVSAWDAQDDRARIESLVPSVITPALVLVIPALAGTVFLAPDILAIVFGSRYRFAWLPLIVFMSINLIEALTGIFARIVRALGDPELIAKARVISLSINVVLNVGLVWAFGLIGAALATGIALTVYTVLVVGYVRRKINVAFPYRRVGWCVVASAVMALTLAVIRPRFAITNGFTLSTVIGVGVVVYFSVLVFYRPLRADILSHVRAIVLRQS